MDSSINGGKPPIMKAVFRRDVAARTAGAISASAGGYAIADTSTTAKVGDICRFETGTYSYNEYPVIAASTNSFTIASKDLPTLGDTFFILGPVDLRLATDGSIAATISGGATEAKQDTMITSLQLLDDSVGTDGSATPVKGFVVGGTDGTNFQSMKMASDGAVQVDIESSALPTGAATETTLLLQATAAKQDLLLAELQLKADLSETQPVSEVRGAVSSNNSSTAALTGAATFTGTSEDVLNYTAIDVHIGTDQDGTLNIDFSSNGTDWDQTESYTVDVTTGGVVQGFFFQLMCEARYFRLRYVNGASAQGVFRLQTILKKHVGTSEVHAVNIPLNGNTDALVTKGVTYGLSTAGGGTYVAVKVTPSGSLTTETTLAAGTALVGKVGIDQTTPGTTNKVSIGTDGTVALNAAIPAGTNNIGDVDVLTLPIAYNAGTVSATTTRTVASSGATGTVASVADSATSVTLLAASTSRLGATFYNNSTVNLYLKFGATATTTDFTVILGPLGYYELPGPNIYNGIIDGIWASNASGACLITSW